ncbi:MAG: transglutaminase-like domain-containing protein [Deltaproteobacteria bacterium]|jgi:transglutaminase-like putative cysteine protease|nr:transglutaminase-like domain-containing protein [Deltaproteobacteria bacterium]
MAVLPAAIAAELTSGEEQVMFSKEVLQETLNRIKTNLAADLPSTTELIFLEDIRNELKRQLLEVENTIEEDLAALPDIPMEEFNTEFDEILDNARRLIYELDNIIISPSIEQIDSVLELIEILEPEIQNEILATKPELPNRIVDTRVNVFKERPVKATGAPVTEADIAETDEVVFTPAIEALASELENDVVKIFTWVKFNIDHEPYYGSIKGSNETLVDMAGNDCDQSSLLLALLRTSGIPSRYVRGDVELKIEDLMNWTGGKTPEAAIAIMQRNKIPTEVIYKFDEPEGVIFDHIWVEAFDGHNWRLMDPSFKTYVYTEGVHFDINEDEANSFIDNMRNFLNTEGNIISINKTVTDGYLDAQIAKFTDEAALLTKGELLGERKILISEKKTLPPYLARGIIGDRKPAEEFSVMPDDMQVKVRVIMPGGNELIMPLATMAGKRVSLVYVGAYPGHQAYIDLVGGIHNLRHPYTGAIVMKPALQIDGETVAEGAFIGLGRTGQSVRVGFLRPGIYDPSNPIWEETNKPLLSGNRYNISITTQRTSTDEIIGLAEALESGAIGLPVDDQMTNEMIDESLRLSGMYYFAISDEFSDYASKALDIVPVNHISMGYICDEVKPVWVYFLWIPLYIDRIARSGAHIDVVRNVVCPTSATGVRADEVSWMGMVGFIGTNMEHLMLELLYGIEAVSTGKIFAKAAEAGVPIHILDDPETLEADLALISAYNVTKNHIRSHVNAGYIAMIPQHSISVENWYGQGWMVLNEATGGAGYMICGGLNNETTMVNGGSLTQALHHLIHKLLHLTHSIKAIAAGTGILVTALPILWAALFVLGEIATLGPAIIFLTSGFLWVIGVALLCTAFVVLKTLLNSFPVVRLIRRREYAYA